MTWKPTLPSIHYATFLVQNVNILAASRAQGS